MAAGSQNSKSNSPIPSRLTIIDYGMGNVRSVQCALDRLGCPSKISSNPEAILNADALVLPGVGAFGKAMENLRDRNLIGVLNEKILQRKTPILGICLGMQLFAETSDEMGAHRGLGWIPGHVAIIDSQQKSLALPHVGWNEALPSGNHTLFQRLENGTHFYFDHSYHFQCDSQYILSRVEYGGPLVSGVRKENVIGVQFHPEKSQTAGLKLLRNFLNISVDINAGVKC